MSATPLELLKRAEAALSAVESDTYYGLHDGDYCVPYGHVRTPRMKNYEDCSCALCSIRQHLAEKSE